MPVTPSLRFGPFELDGRELRLKSSDGPVSVTHKSLLVLQLLLARAGELVSKEELVASVWPRTAISDAALAKRVHELRAALGDDAQQPTYIQTVHRRGFRFIGPVSPVPFDGFELVGRGAALAQIAGELLAVKRGERRLLLLSGEAGIGKTRLLESLLADPALAGCLVGRGHCIPAGDGQPYLPVLEALGELLEADSSGAFARDLRRLAPSWAAALPELGVGPLAPEGLTQQRMLSELATALEHAARHRRVVFACEDLHWADPSTIALLDLLSRRTAPARLLLAATFRDAAVASDSTALRAFLAGRAGRDGCAQLELERLGEADVFAYLERRFDARIACALAPSIYARARGLPLFMTWLANDLLDARRIAFEDGAWRLAEPAERVARALPATLQRLFEVQLAALPRESLEALEAASAIGSSFTPAALAAALGATEAEAEARLRAILGSSFLVARTGAPFERSFALAHELVREALYARIEPERRRALHAACAAHLVVRGGAEPAEIARHHRAAGDGRSAAAQHLEAGRRAQARHALREAGVHFETALGLLDQLSLGETEPALEALLGLGQVMRATLGEASPRRRPIYERAVRLAQRSLEPRRRFEAIYGLRASHFMAGELRAAAELEPPLLVAAREAGDPGLAARAHGQIGERLYYDGEYDAAARELERACELAARATAESGDPMRWVVVGVVAQGTLAQVECELGLCDTALRRIARMLEALAGRPDPYVLGLARWYAAMVHLARQELDASRAQCQSLMALAVEHGFEDLGGWAFALTGYIEATQGDPVAGLAKLERAKAAMEVSGTAINRSNVLLAMASALGRLGDSARACALLDEADALVARMGERHALTAAGTTRADVLLWALPARRDEAHAALHHAWEIALEQRAVIWQVRALAGTLGIQASTGGGAPDAAERLRETLEKLREGHDLLDVVRARQALAASA
ncbi:MAG TPA: AAA family ATPase [Myxococcota bacterium]|nr:AAA family ATPase [Myxococcota bacterium]